MRNILRIIWKGANLLLLFFLFVNNQFSQTTWERLYGLPNRGEMGSSVNETYDNGYLYGIQVQGQSSNQIGTWILKTDINGIPIWSKFFFNANYAFIADIVDVGRQGDIILTGSTYEMDPSGDLVIMRLNSCGEKLWCKYLYYPKSNYGRQIKYKSDGNIVLLSIRASNYWLQEWIQLWDIDTLGNIFFCKQIIPTYNYPFLLYPFTYNLLITEDKGYLLSGFCYFPEDTTNPQGLAWLQHLLIKTDSLGNEEWIIPDTLNMNHKGILNSALELHPSFYVAGFSRNGGIFHPYLGKYTNAGQLSYEHTMHPDTLFTIIFGLREENNFFYQEGQCFYSTDPDEFTGVFKTDTMGIIITSMQNKNGSPGLDGFTNSIDNKYLISGYAPYDYTAFTQLDAWAMKVNENLEYDSLYNFPFIYDSLCPYPISTDTVDCDCDLITGYGEPVREQERYRLHLYPNPADEQVQVKLTDLAGSREKQHNTVVLYDLFGRKVKEKGFEKETVVETGKLNAGVYLVVVEQDRWILVREKLVVL